MAENVSMIGYTRVSKADGSQVHHLQHDALIAAGVDPKRMRKHQKIVVDFVAELGISKATAYR